MEVLAIGALALVCGILGGMYGCLTAIRRMILVQLTAEELVRLRKMEGK